MSSGKLAVLAACLFVGAAHATYFDPETRLEYNMMRTLDPKTGRYIQADPIRMEGGPNRFLYANADPLKYTDPLGLATELERRLAVAVLQCAYPREFSKRPRSVQMVNLKELGTGRTDWFGNIELDSVQYADDRTQVDLLQHWGFLQTMAHEMLHVNEGIGAALASRFRMGSPLGYFHRELDEKAEKMITPELLARFQAALKGLDTGCSCTR